MEEKTAGSIGDTMNAMRSRLDAQRIEPLGFKMNPLGGRGVEFEIRFRDEATRFERRFLYKLAPMRR